MRKIKAFHRPQIQWHPRRFAKRFQVILEDLGRLELFDHGLAAFDWRFRGGRSLTKLDGSELTFNRERQRSKENRSAQISINLDLQPETCP